MRILFLGDSTPYCGSWQRLQALHRLQHDVTSHDIEGGTIRGRWAQVFHYRTGYRWAQRAVAAQLGEWLAGTQFDVAWVEGGAVLGAGPMSILRRHARAIINYNNDDPTGPRDWSRWGTLRRSIPLYDLMVTVREPTRSELEALGARRVARVFMSYDDELLGRGAAPLEADRVSSDVLFVGTWMPERGAFLADLVRRGVPLAIHGNRWRRAKEWNELRDHVRGEGIIGPGYTQLLRGGKINLGLLSKGNRDLHTIRSSEIPYVGSVFCAERTTEHSQMYTEDVEAVFWSNAEECAAHCHALLADADKRQRIAAAGHQRVLQLRLAHTDVLAGILQPILAAGGVATAQTSS